MAEPRTVINTVREQSKVFADAYEQWCSLGHQIDALEEQRKGLRVIWEDAEKKLAGVFRPQRDEK